MSAVEVEIADEGPTPAPEDEGSDRRSSQSRSTRRSASPADVDVEREITKRQLIRTLSSIFVVILYMAFTLLRDRDAGVIVIDGDEADDWQE